MTSVDTQRSIVCDKSPAIAQMYQKYKHTTLYEYAITKYTGITCESPLFLERKKECINSLSTYCLKKFDSHLSQQVIQSLQDNYCVSTADHLGPLGHSFFFQSAILRGMVRPDPIINLCTSHVSLGNSSFPRSILFHSDTGSYHQQHQFPLRLSLFPASKRMLSVFGMRSYTASDCRQKCSEQLHYLSRQNIISDEQYSHMMYFVEHFLLSDRVLDSHSYSEQITKLNQAWWKDIFPDFPDFIGLDAESIVSEILMSHLEKGDFFYSFLTEERLQPFVEKYFDGISCCFDTRNQSGTYLFWYLDTDGKRHALWRKNDKLVTVDGKVRFHLSHEELLMQLSSGRLIPAGLLVYMTFSCYYGLTCFGGFSQGNYLPKIHDGYDTICDILGIKKLPVVTPCDILCEDIVIIKKNNSILTAMDFWLQKNNITLAGLTQAAKVRTIGSSLDDMLPEIIKCL